MEIFTKANAITLCRMILSVVLLFLVPLSVPFMAVYLLCGISDAIDGIVARKTNTTSSLGAKLDTAADVIFVAVCLVKLVPVLHFAPWMYVWTAIIALVKVVNLVVAWKEKKLAATHTLPNKITGCLLFLLPFTLPIMELKYTAVVVCTVATLAAVWETVAIRRKINSVK